MRQRGYLISKTFLFILLKRNQSGTSPGVYTFYTHIDDDTALLIPQWFIKYVYNLVEKHNEEAES